MCGEKVLPNCNSSLGGIFISFVVFFFGSSFLLLLRSDGWRWMVRSAEEIARVVVVAVAVVAVVAVVIAWR